MRSVVFLLLCLAYELHHSFPTPILSLVTSLLCHTSKVFYIWGLKEWWAEARAAAIPFSPGRLTLPSPEAATLPWVSCYFNFI